MENADQPLPCAEKISLETKAAAEGVAAAADWQHGVRLKVYQCKHCQLWHLASST